MTNLSPQAQAIVDAYENTTDKYDALAAVLRVLVDNVAPENYACFSGHRERDEALETRNETIREAILDIATELEQI